jgi:hypothetical protein
MIDEELLRNIEEVHDILKEAATYGWNGSAEDFNSNDRQYKSLRKSLVYDSTSGHKLPKFIDRCRDLHSFSKFIKSKYRLYSERRDYLDREFEPFYLIFKIKSDNPSDEIVSEILSRCDSEYVHKIWQKALERRTTDPEGAITAARSLLESVCKYILDEKGVSYNAKADLPSLYSSVTQQLDLAPSKQTEEQFKKILGGCHVIVENIGSLRNNLSDSHGRSKSDAKPAPRHAELAVNLAGTMATFLITTWEEINT